MEAQHELAFRTLQSGLNTGKIVVRVAATPATRLRRRPRGHGRHGRAWPPHGPVARAAGRAAPRARLAQRRARRRGWRVGGGCASGVRVELERCDAGEAAHVVRLVAAALPLSGVWHAAGVLADGVVPKQAPCAGLACTRPRRRARGACSCRARERAARVRPLLIRGGAARRRGAGQLRRGQRVPRRARPCAARAALRRRACSGARGRRWAWRLAARRASGWRRWRRRLASVASGWRRGWRRWARRALRRAVGAGRGAGGVEPLPGRRARCPPFCRRSPRGVGVGASARPVGAAAAARSGVARGGAGDGEAHGGRRGRRGRAADGGGRRLARRGRAAQPAAAAAAGRLDAAEHARLRPPDGEAAGVSCCSRSRRSVRPAAGHVAPPRRRRAVALLGLSALLPGGASSASTVRCVAACGATCIVRGARRAVGRARAAARSPEPVASRVRHGGFVRRRGARRQRGVRRLAGRGGGDGPVPAAGARARLRGAARARLDRPRSAAA